MSYNDFWYNYTLTELWNAIEGYYEGEERREKAQWERTRLIYAAVLNKPVYGYKPVRKNPEQWLPFPWDNSAIPDKEELDKLRQETWPQEQ
jgi:hypothetical protein